MADAAFADLMASEADVRRVMNSRLKEGRVPSASLESKIAPPPSTVDVDAELKRLGLGATAAIPGTTAAIPKAAAAPRTRSSTAATRINGQPLDAAIGSPFLGRCFASIDANQCDDVANCSCIVLFYTGRLRAAPHNNYSAGWGLRDRRRGDARGAMGALRLLADESSA